MLFLVLLTIIFMILKISGKFNLSLFITLCCTLILYMIVQNPKLCIDSALNGVKLFFNSVFPSLFPFLVIVNIIIAFNGISIYSKFLGPLLCRPLKLPSCCSIVLIVSLLCGYPLGAKYTVQLYEKRLINLKTSQRLLSIASNASPLFIIGSVGTSMLCNTYLGYILLISNMVSCFFIGIITKPKIFNMDSNGISEISTEETNIGNALRNGIDDAIKTSLMVGGFVTIFSVFINIIKNNAILDIAFSNNFLSSSTKNILSSFFVGTIEMTNGTYTMSICNEPTITKLIVISFLISFSGLSIISQVYSFTYKHPMSIIKYIKYKIFQGCISSSIACIMYMLLHFNNIIPVSNNAVNITLESHNFLVIASLILICVPILIHHIKNLFNFS